MREQEIIECNRIISDFMGLRHGDIKDNRHLFPFGKHKGYCRSEKLKYHSDWNWLVPAIQKWDVLYRDREFNAVYAHLSDQLDNAVTMNYDIMQAWKQLVECINWYNQTNPKPKQK